MLKAEIQAEQHQREYHDFVEQLVDIRVFVRHVGAVRLLPPDDGGYALSSKVGAAGAASDAAYLWRDLLEYLLHRGEQFRNDGSVSPRRLRCLFILREAVSYLDAVLLLRFFDLRLNDLPDIFKRRRRQHAAVEAEGLHSWHGVDIRHIRAASCRLKGRSRWVKKFVGLRESRVQRLVQRDGESVRRAAGVDPQVRQARVHLFSLHREFHPADALLGDLHKVGLFRSHVGDDDQVVFIKKPLLDKILYPVRAAHLFVGDEGEADLIFRRKIKLLDRVKGIERGDDLLAVVVYAASIDTPVLDYSREGVRLPQGALSLGDDVGVRHYPEAAFGLTGEADDDIRSLAAGSLRIGRGIDLHILKAQLFYLLQKVLRLVKLSLSAVQRADRRI